MGSKIFLVVLYFHILVVEVKVKG